MCIKREKTTKKKYYCFTQKMWKKNFFNAWEYLVPWDASRV